MNDNNQFFDAIAKGEAKRANSASDPKPVSIDEDDTGMFYAPYIPSLTTILTFGKPLFQRFKSI